MDVNDVEKTKILQPSVPLSRPIPGGLQVGKMIEIRGHVPYGSDVFQINFAAGEDKGDYVVNKLLHLSIRFNQHKVVRNVFLNGQWGSEEIDSAMPFETGKPFIILILVDLNCYRIAVDGRHHWEFPHQLDISFVSHIFIAGSVDVNEIKFFDQANQPTQVGTCILPPFPDGRAVPQLLHDPKIPLDHFLAGGLKPGMIINICGRSFFSATRFTINLQAGSLTYPPPDIGLHFDVRFFNNTVVRNSRANNTWQNEESQIPFFPFALGQDFDLILKIEANKILISINGKSSLEFLHRSFPISKFDTLHIQDEVIISLIKIDTI